MLTEKFDKAVDSLIAPSIECFAITPNDSDNLTRATKALYVGTGGDIVLRAIGSDADVIFRNLATGSILDIRTKVVRTTGTTAQDIVRLA